MTKNPRVLLLSRGGYVPGNSSGFTSPIKRFIFSAVNGTVAGSVSGEFERAGAEVKSMDVYDCAGADLERELGISDVLAVSPKLVDYPAAIRAGRSAKRLGKPVVFGGTQPSLKQDDLIREEGFSVVVGEFEGLGERVLQGLLAGDVRAYSRESPLDLRTEYVRPDRTKLFPSRIFQGLETSRGCHNSCSPYCTILSRGNWRGRDVGEVAGEVDSIRSHFISLVDNNVVAVSPEADSIGNPAVRENQIGSYERGIELFEMLKKKGKYVIAQMSPGAILYDLEHGENLLKAMSGTVIDNFMGIEVLEGSVSGSKDKSSENYGAVIKALHRHRIPIDASLIFGFDGQSPEVFREAYAFLIENHVDAATLQIATPYPGTGFYSQMQKAGRIILPYGLSDETLGNAAHYKHKLPVFLPEMGVDALMDGYIDLTGKVGAPEYLRKVYSDGDLYPKRLPVSLAWNALCRMDVSRLKKEWASVKPLYKDFR